MQAYEKIGLGLILCLPLAACGGDDDDTSCDVAAQTGCDNGQVCERVRDGEPTCFDPVLLRGEVFELGNEAAIGGARVVALDINGAPISDVSISGDDGTYTLAIPSTRDVDGVPEPVEFTLRADAQSYQSFPSGLRQALPLNTETLVEEEGALVVDSPLSLIGLLPFAEGGNTGTITGSVDVPDTGVGVLVVADSGQGQSPVAIANRGGDFTIFNVPTGTNTVQAYAQGFNYDSADTEVSAGESSEVNLSLNEEAPGTVTGNVQIVNAPGGAQTSVILVVESTFDEVFGRGQSIPGMRDPESGVAPNITDTYTIEGVPAGRYVVLGAFEDDALVRDPDESIGGTSTLHIEVTAGGTTEVDGFKITEALEVLSPGADGPEEVSGTPVFSWVDDSSEDEYLVEVFDSFGEIIWDTTIPGESGNDPSVTYEGPALEPGGFYQFRATSFKGAALSRTEDLKGIFFVP